MGLLNSFVIFNVLRCCEPPMIVSARLTHWTAVLRAHMKVPQGPRAGACDRQEHLCFAGIRAVLYHQDSDPVLSVALAAACFALQLRSFFSLATAAVLRRYPPDVVLKQETVAVRAHVRQCDASLLLHWRDASPHKVRALYQHHLRNALSWTLLLEHPVITFVQR